MAFGDSLSYSLVSALTLDAGQIWLWVMECMLAEEHWRPILEPQLHMQPVVLPEACNASQTKA